MDRCINAGSNPNERDSSGSTPLHLAAVHGGPTQVRVLLSHGADFEDRDAKGRTPLHSAARQWEDIPENITALVDAGADVDARDESGETPLHLAASGGTVANIKALLDAGADVNARDKDGETPLHAAGRRHAPGNMLALLEAGADLNAHDESGNSPLHVAVRPGNSGGIKALLDAGATVDASNEFGATPLHGAAARATPVEIAILVDAGADPNAQDKFGRTPLHQATMSSSPESIAALLEVGAELESRDIFGWTPLRRAAVLDLPETKNALLEAGADPGTVEDGKSLLEAVKEASKPQHVAEPAAILADCTQWTSQLFFLLATPGDVARCIDDWASPAGGPAAWTPLHMAAAAGRPDHVAAILRAGGEIESRALFGLTPLHAAVTNAVLPPDIKAAVEGIPNVSWPDTASRLASIAVLLDAGADSNARDQFGGTLLHSAATQGQPEYIAALVEAGLDINARDESGQTPLHSAVSVDLSGESALASLLDLGPEADAVAERRARLAANIAALIDAGADVHARDEKDGTPLHSAVGSGEPEYIAVLVDAGADINAQGESGQTPLHTAAAANTSMESYMSLLDLPPDADLDARQHARLATLISALIDAGADIHLRDNEGRTPLHTAATDGIPESVEAILKAGADIDIGDDAGDTPLHLALNSKTSENIVALLAAGANPDAKNGAGRTPLHEAAWSKAEHLSVLISAGARLDAGDQYTAATDGMVRPRYTALPH